MSYGKRKYVRHKVTRFHIYLYVIFFAASLVTLSFYFELFDISYYAGLPHLETNKNYFVNANQYVNMGYIVNTSTCHIPNISIWDSSMKPFLKSDKTAINCKRRMKPWTYVLGQKVIIDTSALKELRHSMKTISCCYKSIRRVEESRAQYNTSADNLFSYSEKCYHMEEETEPNEQFIRVICKRIDSLVSTINLYENFHAIAFANATNKNIQRKLKYWKTHASETRPPNVIMIGIDSTSRLNFHRFAPKTRATLEEIGAFEMYGYTKVGENTFPNFIPIMSSYSENQLKKICYYNRNVLMDDCPFIWKDLNVASYLTAHIEDSPLLAIFNYMKTGFVKAPVDLYFRPFMMAVHDSFSGFPYTIDCIGYQSVDEVLSNYIADVIQLMAKEDVPLFLTSWLTNLSHDDMNNLRFSDDIYANLLKKLHSRGLLNNTVLFFMSDHGYRFGGQRETLSGWYEDKLPNMWIYISLDLQERMPGWRQALQLNSKRLSTPFDVHKTFIHILNVFSSKAMKESQRNRKVPRGQMGQSLISELPNERTCKQAGIPDNYCACTPPHKLEMNESLIGAAQAAVSHINSMIPAQCSTLVLYSLTAGALWQKARPQNDNSYDIIIVAFTTRPGNFIFEALVNYSQRKAKYSVTTDILRMNRINSPTGCISDPVLEVFCYCL